MELDSEMFWGTVCSSEHWGLLLNPDERVSGTPDGEAKCKN